MGVLMNCGLADADVIKIELTCNVMTKTKPVTLCLFADKTLVKKNITLMTMSLTLSERKAKT